MTANRSTTIDTWLQPLPHGITLSCRGIGKPGRPVVMFLHGFPEAAFVWDDLMRATAARGFRCVAPNLRGFEASSAPADVADYRPKHLVRDIVELIAAVLPQGESALACLVAHDWGGAVAWNLANQHPALLRQLAILNSPHPGTFLRELQRNPEQQRASDYMNFLTRPDAEALLAANDFARLWPFLRNNAQGRDHDPAWLTDAVRAQYRAVWSGALAQPPLTGPGAGLRGGCNYYRASPLRPPSEADAAAAAVTLPREMLTVNLPTLVLWGLQDIALQPGLIDGLEEFVPRLTLRRVADASHWIVHEQPEWVAQQLGEFLAINQSP